ncbi:hypothetical protein [Leeuwenhoekiella marinoflava]|uniref:hypothetical protein n=1 Tax=Leeuwenhoekiella marinoflava TaxID=988 RepID=UPI003003411B
MTEITFEYWNKLADQTITISSLLGGFSIAVVANLLVSNVNNRLSKTIMIVSTLAAIFFNYCFCYDQFIDENNSWISL